MNNHNQRGKGVVLSYLNTAINMGMNLILIPMLIAALSDTQYGIYKVMQSFAGPLLMLNLGMSTIVSRSVARFQELRDERARKDKENTFGLAVLISVLMAGLVVLAGTGMKLWLPRLFSNTYSEADLLLAEKVFMIFVYTTALHILSDTFKGCVLGRERFVFYYGITTVHYIIRFAAIVILVRSADINAVYVARVDLAIYGAMLLVNLLYSVVILGERIQFHGIQKQELISIVSFSSAILLQAIVNQVNNSLDNVILGAMITDKRVITMYSSALSIFGIYNSVLSVLANVYFPKASRLIARDTDAEELTDFVIGPGRMQAVIAVAILCAFGLFGRDFIDVWIGEAYRDAAWVAFVLMIPVTIPLVQNLCLAILNAKLKQLFRSGVLFCMAVMNLILSVALVSLIGYWGAALGTAISLILGHGIVMNVYYAKVLKLNVIRMFREIFAGILPAGMLSACVCLPLCLIEKSTIVMLLCECTAFVAVYGFFLWIFGIKKTEKGILIGYCKTIFSQKNKKA